MFLPFAGPIIGMAILFNTGYALGAIASVQGYPVIIALLAEFLTPIFWLEFIAYSTAMTASIWLTRRLLQGRWRELKNTAIQIGICALILIISAAIEAWLISIGL
jgi:membrane protein implicated in regulation of membrane protease activity